jgi:hypothetical protein
MITATDCGSRTSFHDRYCLSDRIGMTIGSSGTYVPEAIWRLRARLKVRLKWRSDSGPVWRMPV